MIATAPDGRLFDTVTGLFVSNGVATDPAAGLPVDYAAQKALAAAQAAGDQAAVAAAQAKLNQMQALPAQPPGGGGGGGASAPPPDPWNSTRQSAFDRISGAFSRWGIDMNGSGLSAQLRQWILDDRSDEGIITEFRNSSAYAARFTGMADLVKKGQAISEAEYIAQERAYRGVMQQWGIPSGFYDDPTDYGRFIANGVSVKELDDRIKDAKTFMDANAPAEYKQALSMYGITDGGMLAYVLDGDKAQSLITQQVKAAAFKGASDMNGFGLDKAGAEKYGSTLGANFDSFGVDQRMQLDSTLSGLGDIAKNQEKLAQIDREQFTRSDTLDAELLSDSSKKAASQKRALRETARFNGAAGVNSGSLSRQGSV